MARALTADEQQRYPWASRISDFVPVGRWRKIGLWCVFAGVILLVLGLGFLYVTAADIKEGVGILDSPLGIGTLAVAGLLFGIAFAIGLVTAVQAAVHSAKTPLLWSLGCMVPVFLAAVISLL